MKKLILIVFIGFIVFLFPFMSQAAAPFYEGKIIRIVVGNSPGGGFDLYSRAIARHMGKHIPGDPKIIVENMPGAATLIAANYVYKIAKPDGLTIGNINGGLFMGQVMNQEGIDFDARKFEHVGVPTQEHIVFAFTKRSGIDSMEKWINSKRPLKMGGTGPGSITPDQATKIVKEALGLPIQLISGYKGTAEVRLACEGGELDGTCRTFDSMRMDWKKAWETGEVVIVLQAAATPLPELPGVPLAMNYAKTPEARQLIQVGIYDPSKYLRPYVLPPGTPKDRVQILRDAFMRTMKDAEFKGEAEKAKMSLDPVSGEELEKLVLGIFSVDKALVSKLKVILEL